MSPLIYYNTRHLRPSMSAITKFTDALYDKFPEITEDIKAWAANYIEEDSKAYNALKDTGKVTFGKYKGYSIAELNQAPKGAEYISWLLNQTWFEESKFPQLFADIKRLNIKKKVVKRVALN